MITHLRDILSQAEAPSLPVMIPKECHISDLPWPSGSLSLPPLGAWLLSAFGWASCLDKLQINTLKFCPGSSPARTCESSAVCTIENKLYNPHFLGVGAVQAGEAGLLGVLESHFK